MRSLSGNSSLCDIAKVDQIEASDMETMNRILGHCKKYLICILRRSSDSDKKTSYAGKKGSKKLLSLVATTPHGLHEYIVKRVRALQEYTSLLSLPDTKDSEL